MASTLDEKLAQLLVEFAHTLTTEFSVTRILDRLVDRIVDLLPVTGAGVMVAQQQPHELHFVAASNLKIMQVEVLQNELHEGPCLQAYRTGEPVAVPDLAVDTQFPRFSPRALDEGMAAVFTFPMRLDQSRLGAVDVYRDTPGPLTEQETAAGQVLADVAAAYLHNGQVRVDASATVARLNHRSLHDALTGLPNRTLFEELLEQGVARARRSHHQVAVLFIDLDRFKTVNDRYGHHVGDALLVAVAARMQSAIRPGDTLARLSGDEFVALCEDLPTPAAGRAVADRILAALAVPFAVADRTLAVSASVGIAFSGPGQDIPEELLRDADFAMYQAKSSGGGQHAVVLPQARLAADSRLDLEDDLGHAQQRGEFQLLYQPIIDIRTQRRVAVEALLRWEHPSRGQVPPDVVVPSAERSGLIQTLGLWVLQQACADRQHWESRAPDLHVTVNVSAQQVMGADFAEKVRTVLARTGVDPAALTLEVTESILLSDAARALAVLREVKQLGVRLSLDDFGTGYSSLSYLRDFPFDIVKIDRSFTSGLDQDGVTRAIISAMIDLGHVLDLTVTAEGVETADELEALTALGADQAQGFYLGRPVPADALPTTSRLPVLTRRS